MLELNDNLYVLLQVIKTERAGHAREVMTRITEEELNALDGVVVVVRTFYLLREFFPYHGDFIAELEASTSMYFVI